MIREKLTNEIYLPFNSLSDSNILRRSPSRIGWQEHIISSCLIYILQPQLIVSDYYIVHMALTVFQIFVREKSLYTASVIVVIKELFYLISFQAFPPSYKASSFAFKAFLFSIELIIADTTATPKPNIKNAPAGCTNNEIA